MFRTFLTVAFLASVSLTTLMAAGCAYDDADRPAALTGEPTTYNDNWRYTDDKGRYHPEWRTNPPVGYPKGRGVSRP